MNSEGRVFGRINLFDAAAVLLVLALGALAVAGYALLRVPTIPRITSVTPATLTAGSDLRVDIKGENLLPYLRLYIQRSGEAATVMHDTTPRSDGYQLVNFARAALLVESPVLAEVRLPGGILPGTYDLVLHDESKVLSVRRAAFTIVALPDSAPRNADVTVRFVGRPAVVALMREQDVDVPADKDGSATIASIRRRAEAPGDFVDSVPGSGVRGADQVGVVECVLRVPVKKTPEGWSYRTRTLKAGVAFTFQTEQYVVVGTIDRVEFPSR